jgi:hypothetical protein
MAKKTAMVSPVPAKPAEISPAEPLRLQEILAGLGNDRPYFIIDHHHDTWTVFFQGDEKPKTITLKDGKWVVK